MPAPMPIELPPMPPPEANAAAGRLAIIRTPARSTGLRLRAIMTILPLEAQWRELFHDPRWKSPRGNPARSRGSAECCAAVRGLVHLLAPGRAQDVAAGGIALVEKLGRHNPISAEVAKVEPEFAPGDDDARRLEIADADRPDDALG